jgi:perosamine synthetase
MKRWWLPEIGELEQKLVQEVLQSHYVNEGEVTSDFEKRLADLLNVPYVVATTSGTSALYLSLAALGIGPGDEVVVPDITFIATANAARLAGATIVLADVNEKNLLLDPRAFEKVITKKTKAVMPVHISGHAAPLEEIRALAKANGIFVVEDAAEALNSRHKGQALGTIGELGALSFSANKAITTGQGGAVLTRDKKLYEKIVMLKDQGRPVRGTGGNDIHFTTGYNFKLTNLQAAVGVGQLSYLHTRMKRFRELHSIYQNEFQNLKGLHILPFSSEEQPLWTDAICERRDELCEHLATNGFECRKFWYPLHTQAPYKDSDQRFPVASKVGPQAFWLPSSFLLTNDDISTIVKLVKKFFS